METNKKGAKMSLNSVSSLFHDSLELYEERFPVVSEIVLLPTLIMILGYCLGLISPIFSAVGSLVVLAGWITFIFSVNALIFSIHHDAGVDASYHATTKFFWPLVWMSIIATFASIGATAMLIIPGIWLAIAVGLRNYTLVLEERKGIDSLRQSKDYIKGYWWAVLGRVLLLFIVFIAVSAVVQFPFSLIGSTTLQGLVSLIMILFIVPFSMIFIYGIYENLRTLKPELRDAHPSGDTFIKVSTIVGIVVTVLIIMAAAVGIAYAVKNHAFDHMYMMDQQNNNAWQNQYPTSNQ